MRSSYVVLVAEQRMTFGGKPQLLDKRQIQEGVILSPQSQQLDFSQALVGGCISFDDFVCIENGNF